MIGRKLSIGAALCASVAATALADVSVSGFFTDNMVLQRDKSVPVWGKADPGESVTASYGGKTVSGRADGKGEWKVRLPAMKWSGEGKSLTVKGAKNEVALKNIVVGDVWMISGQSNAEMSFSWGVIQGKEAMAAAKDFPNIRTVKFRHETNPFGGRYEPCNWGGWQVCRPDNMRSVTVLGYFFAKELNERTGIPIGILDNNWSGCRVEPFTPEAGMKTVPELAKDLADFRAQRQKLVDWCSAVSAARESGRFDAAGIMPEISMWTRQYNAMVAPITEFPIAGATWYQGCSNEKDGLSYAPKLKALVNGWRKAWGYEFPFYIVQLASFGRKNDSPAGGDGFSAFREAQRLVSLDVPKSGLAVAIDIGNGPDIHPKNKVDVADRLARWARRDVYGEKGVVVSGPMFREQKIEANRIRLTFDHVASGLMAGERDPDAPKTMPVPTEGAKLRGFAIAGADKKWHFADAVIDGDTVVVSSAEVAQPVAVRYAYRANALGDCNLYNKDGLPAVPFRTDSW